MSFASKIINRSFLSIMPSVALISTALAEENLWLYTQGTDTRPKNSWELKLGDTLRIGKGSGDYSFHDVRPAVEYGVTDKLTVGFQLAVFDHKYSVDDPNLNPMFDTQGGAGGEFNKTQYSGYRVNVKYNVLSPYKDLLGLSLGFAYDHRLAYRLDGAEISQDSFVPGIFLQKNFLDDTLVTAFRGVLEFERRATPGVLEEEIAVDMGAGIAYRFAPKWFAGVECRYQSDFLNPQSAADAGTPGYDASGFEDGYDRSNFDLSDFRWGSQYQYGTYVGPSIHYAEKNWWVTASVLLQVQGGGSEGRNPNIRGGKNYDEHERLHLGLTVGYEF